MTPCPMTLERLFPHADVVNAVKTQPKSTFDNLPPKPFPPQQAKSKDRVHGNETEGYLSYKPNANLPCRQPRSPRSPSPAPWSAAQNQMLTQAKSASAPEPSWKWLFTALQSLLRHGYLRPSPWRCGIPGSHGRRRGARSPRKLKVRPGAWSLGSMWEGWEARPGR